MSKMNKPMATGSLKLHVTDMLDEPIDGRIEIEFAPKDNSAGGDNMEVAFANDAATDFIVEQIECRGGPGTMYTVRLNAQNFKPYSFFQLILEKRVNTPSDSKIRLSVDPKRVKDIAAPAFTSLLAAERSFLDSADMNKDKPEDQDLLGLTGPALYDGLGPLRRASLLNVLAKTKHGTTGRCFRFLQSLMVLRQDRCFCTVDPAMPEFLRKSDFFKSAPATLHDPLKDFVIEDSFKSKDAHANLQVTFQRHKSNGTLAADVDIDEASGIEHGFEVIRNKFRGRTNPFLVRELMLAFDPIEKTLDPRYSFVFA
jgi:hypothetical protein